MSEQTDVEQPEFSYFVDCGKLRSGGKTYKIEANSSEREALAKRFSIDSLELLKAEFILRHGAGGVIDLTGNLQATLTQTCIISLKPLVSDFNFAINRTYSATATHYWGQQEEPDEDGNIPGGSPSDDPSDPSEPLENGGIDLGEVASQELAVEIDPFPRLAGAEFDSGAENNGDKDAEEIKNPFAVLEKLKKKLD